VVHHTLGQMNPNRAMLLYLSPGTCTIGSFYEETSVGLRWIPRAAVERDLKSQLGREVAPDADPNPAA
jgi:hypothetical protein